MSWVNISDAQSEYFLLPSEVFGKKQKNRWLCTSGSFIKYLVFHCMSKNIDLRHYNTIYNNVKLVYPE